MRKFMMATLLAITTICPSIVFAQTSTYASNTACLIAAAWNEARGRSTPEVVAVMYVVLNRVKHAKFKAQNACDVVLAKGQFQMTSSVRNMVVTAKRTGRVNLNLTQPADQKAFQRISAIAHVIQDGHTNDPSGGATHFYSPKLRVIMGLPKSPNWALKLKRTTVIGEFHFHHDM